MTDVAAEVVISGLSCRLPESDNVAEFREHLITGDDMVTDDDRRWHPGRAVMNACSFNTRNPYASFEAMISSVAAGLGAWKGGGTVSTKSLSGRSWKIVDIREENLSGRGRVQSGQTSLLVRS